MISPTPAVDTNRPVAVYTINEAAVLLRMSTKSVRRQIIRGNLRRCTKFGKILIPRRDVDSYFEKFAGY